MDAPELLKSLGTKIFGVPEDKIADTFFTGTDDSLAIKDDAADILIRLDAERIKAMKDRHAQELTEMHDKGHKKAKSEVLTEWEKELKKSYGYEGEDTGFDFIKNLIAAQSKTQIKDVKLTPEYLALEQKVNKDIEALNKQWEEKIAAKDIEVNRIRVNTIVRQDAQKELTQLNPILSENPTVRNTQIENFLKAIEAKDFQISEDGNHIVIENGKRMENQHGHPLPFKDFIRQVALMNFDFKKQDQKGGGGNEPATVDGITLPATFDEFQKLVTELPLDKKAAYIEAWRKKQGIK